MKFCNYRVYICLSANIDQLEIKLQKRKAEKNKNQKKKRKLTFLRNFPFRPFPFPALPFLAVTHLSASLLLPACGPSGHWAEAQFPLTAFLSLRLTSGTRATATGRLLLPFLSAADSLFSLPKTIDPENLAFGNRFDPVSSWDSIARGLLFPSI